MAKHVFGVVVACIACLLGWRGLRQTVLSVAEDQAIGAVGGALIGGASNSRQSSGDQAREAVSGILEAIDAHPESFTRTDHGFTPLHTLIQLDDVRRMIAKGANVNAKNDFGKTPLHYVQSVAVAQALIDAGADVDAVDVYGSTPLYYVKTPAIAQVLIGSRALVRSIDPKIYSSSF